MIRVELIALVAIASPARAVPRTAQAAIESCAEAPFERAQLQKVLRLELAANEVALTETSTSIDLLLTIRAVSCGASSNEVAIAALDTETGLGSMRSIHVERGPAVARVVAVAVAELVRDLAKPATTPVRTATVARIVVRPPSIEAAPPPKERALALQLGADVFPGIASAQSSLLCTYSFVAFAHARLEAGVSANYGLERDVRGKIDLLSVAPTFALRATTALETTALETTALETIELELGPRAAIGWIRASGRPDSSNFAGEHIDGLLAELWLELLVSWRVNAVLSLGARAGAGYVLSGLIAKAEGNDITGVDGAALGFALFGAYRF